MKEETELTITKRDAFITNRSQQIQSPLNNIIGSTELLLDTDLSAVQRDYVEKIKISGDSLTTIVNDIIDYSNIEAGKIAAIDGLRIVTLVSPGLTKYLKI